MLDGGFRWFLVVASSVRWSLAVVGRCSFGVWWWFLVVDVTVVLGDDRWRQ